MIEAFSIYSENQFLKHKQCICILNMTIENAFTKFDELEAFNNRVNKGNTISVVCLNECWLSEIRDGSNLNLTNYNLFNQIGKMPWTFSLWANNICTRRL